MNSDQTALKLKRYLSVVQQFQEQGDFLTYAEHQDWLACYEQDAQSLKTLRPLLVFRPYSTKIISSFVQACCIESIPLTVRNGGTSLQGGAVCSQEGIILLVSHLNKILEYDSCKGIILIEPGVTVTQLNHYVAQDRWEFALEMAANGVAGLGGCLSCQAKGYDQGAHPLYHSIRCVQLVNGKGEILQVPGSLVCGAEGIWGVIIQIEIQLTKKPAERVRYSVDLSLDKSLDFLPQLRFYQCLKTLFWQNDRLILGLEGEEWRLKAAIHALKSLMSMYSLVITDEKIIFPGQSVGSISQIILSSALPTEFLLKGKAFIIQSSQARGLKSQIALDILAGHIHIHLSAFEDSYSFNAKLEKWMIDWVEFLEQIDGAFISINGIGKVWNPYLPPFLKEDELNFWKSLQATFDPNQILSRDRFFPEEGKCLRLQESLSNE